MNASILKVLSKVFLLSVVTVASGIYLRTTNAIAQQENQQEQGQGNSGAQARKLQGTWRAIVTLKVCQTDAEIRTFPAITIYDKDGTFHAVAAGLSPTRIGPDYGTWRQTGKSTYLATSEAFLFSAAGDWTGTQRIIRSIEFGSDPNKFTAETATQILDVNGNLIATGCATGVATRFDE